MASHTRAHQMPRVGSCHWRCQVDEKGRVTSMGVGQGFMRSSGADHLATPSRALVYASEHMEVHFIDRGGDVLLITFNEIGMRADGARFWADGLAKKLNLSVAGFVSREPNWFPSEDALRAISALERWIGGRFPQRVCYGLSQGAHAILRFKRELGATVVLAFSPQASINPADIVDERFLPFFKPNLHKNMVPLAKGDPAPAYVFYDPRDERDNMHVALIRARMPLVEFALPFIGHSSAVPFAHSDVMRELIGAALRGDAATLRRIGVAARRRSPSRAYTLCHASHTRHPRTTLRVFRKYRDVQPAENWWLIARLLGMQGLGQDVIGWMLGKCVELPGRAEVLACTAMVAIEISDRHMAIRFSEAALQLDPENKTWVWIHERARCMPA